MVTSLYPEVRRQEILKHLNRQGQVTVVDLSRRFDVSEVTIRADLQILAEKSLLIRTHGGAIPINRVPELSLTIRRQRQITEKERIGATGAKMVSNGEAIFLDSSSTALAVARNLKSHRDLTIITNSLAVAQAIVEEPGVTVVMPGGTVQRDTLSLIGTEGVRLLKKFNIQKGFFGAHGINYPEGLTDVSAAEAQVKRLVLSMCREVIAVVDSTKWGRVGLASFSHLNELDVIITDLVERNALTEQAESFGVKIIQV